MHSEVGKITLTKSSLASLLDAALNPNPDDSGGTGPWGPFGPGGPVIHDRLSWALLNPQPLPPGPDPYRALLWAMLNPQPLPPGPDPYRSLLWALLNPQPLPPGPDPFRSHQWGMLNPQPLPPGPDPYRSALLARAVVDRAVLQSQLAEILGGANRSEGSFDSIRSQISEFVDDYCGTGPRRWPHPGPWPPGWEKGELPAIDLLVAGAQFQKAADALANSPLRGDFAGAADRLLEVGLNRLESARSG